MVAGRLLILKGAKTTITTNVGNKIDITPSTKHSVVNEIQE